tara:strand:- start:1503 stop:1724 length:222 start_codon:yes stop_codon:yes gene_type:complete
MTTTETQQIRKIQTTLQNINNGTKVFFNVAQYQRLGLVVVRKKWAINAVGNKIENGHTFHLTPKAKSYLTAVL